MNIALLPIAQAELDEIFAWYEDQGIGLGYEFLDGFDKSVKLIASFPNLFQEVDQDLRRCLMNRFPYAVVYGHDEDKIIIVAIAHSRRQPKYWIDRYRKTTY